MPDLPPRPDLRHLRDEAKHRKSSGEFASLSEAQFAIANSYGFASWPRLKAFAETRALDLAARSALLVRSACSDDPRLARLLLDEEPALASYDLVTACVCGEAKTVRRLLAPAAVDDRLAPLHWTPLLYACFSRLLRGERANDIVEVAGLLLAEGADPNASWLHNDYLQVPLYGAAGIANNAELTGLLLAAGADPDETLSDPEAIGETLYHAVEFADTTCARLLLEAGTALRKVTYCLGRALDFDRTPMVELLLAHGARPSISHLDKAIRNRRPLALIDSLLNAGTPVSQTSVLLAIRTGRPDVAELLVERGADAVVVATDDAEPDAEPDADLLNDAVQLGDADLVRSLLAAGLSPDAVSVSNPGPALGSAAWRGYADVVQVLVDAGAALSWPDGSPVGAALHGSRHCHDPQGGPMSLPIDEVRHGDYPRVVRILLAAGADVPTDYSEGDVTAAGILADLGIEASV